VLDAGCLITHLEDEVVRVALELLAKQVVVDHVEICLQALHVNAVSKVLSPCNQS
jgi:hypothetical protein